ncbi:uncharacterized protein LOC127463835 [Manacus candei]|uniref:uncharacterized protein LOC127463835 n=1 Tax=Manacus candei TaxID=415023 RepID=UPI002226E098|nr:uncharacterized protein LOC127463835 [Manacus candei]
MANAEEQLWALSDTQVLVLMGISLPAALLRWVLAPLPGLELGLGSSSAGTFVTSPDFSSLLGSGSVLAVASRQRRCCHIQLRPLALLALADFLGAAALLGTATLQLLPAPLSVPAYAACPYGRMLVTTFYSVSFLMVVVYAYESYRTVLGGRARPAAALQVRDPARERSRCLESAWQGIPYILAWLVPALTLLGQLLARGTPGTDIAPVVPWKGNGSHGTFGLYCSSCLLLIHPTQDICYQYLGENDAGLAGKILFLLYLLLVLGCCTLLYRRVRLRCRGTVAVPLLPLERDAGFGGGSGRSVSKASRCFQLVFLLCWTPGKSGGVSQGPPSPAGSRWGCPTEDCPFVSHPQPSSSPSSPSPASNPPRSLSSTVLQ